ncbi:hypothetical protein [Brevibacillus choshinensis]|uniref:hypothetical protein n=1 Tax=Brevibacillus choshinensis TaxID=54911 RepID=UPI002E2084E5|nr:hypothetical protein [Brevibacillus choshinensis]
MAQRTVYTSLQDVARSGVGKQASLHYRYFVRSSTCLEFERLKNVLESLDETDFARQRSMFPDGATVDLAEPRISRQRIAIYA